MPTTLASIIKTAFTRFINSKEKQLHNSNFFRLLALHSEQGHIWHTEQIRVLFYVQSTKSKHQKKEKLSVFLHIYTLVMSKPGIKLSRIHHQKKKDMTAKTEIHS